MTKCQNNAIKFVTDYGTLSVTERKGYFYATRTVNNRKRQIYLGKSIPDSFILNEVAKDIFSSDKEYWQRHSKQIPRATGKDTIGNSTLRDDLTRIAALAKARGEDLICQELRNLIKNLT